MQPNYFQEYLHSKLHLWIGLGCLGLALFSLNFAIIILAAAVYAAAMWLVHDLPSFKKQVDDKYNAEQQAIDYKKVSDFKANRDRQVMALTKTRQGKYLELSEICKGIERSTMEQVGEADAASDDRIRKLEELLYTYLKLLSIEQSLEQFIEVSRDENVAKEIDDAQASVDDVTHDIETMMAKTDANPATLQAKQRLQTSYKDRLEVLKKRLNKLELAKTNIELVSAEQSRLNDQVRLIRDDSLSSRNADAISDRIDATAQNLENTNQWLTQMNEFKDVVGDMPPTSSRMGFDAPVAVQNPNRNPITDYAEPTGTISRRPTATAAYRVRR